MNLLSKIAFGISVLLASLSLAGADLKMLIDQPQFAPETTTITEDMKFARNVTIKKGTKFNIVEIRKDGVSVALQGRPEAYGVPADATTVLADADAYIASLTPEQQKMTVEQMLARKEAWPYRVKIKGVFRFGNGQTFKPGDEGVLRELNAKDAVVYIQRLNGNYTFPAGATSAFKDILAAVANPPKLTRFYSELKEHLLDFPTNKPTNVFDEGGPQYVALYNAAGWCPFCAQVNEDVVKWFNDNAASRKKIQLILVSNDKADPDRDAYMKKLGINIPYVKVRGFDQMPFLQETKVLEGLPYLLIVDRNGKTVFGESNAQPKERTMAALGKMTEITNAPAPAPTPAPTPAPAKP